MTGFSLPESLTGGALHRYRRGQGSNAVQAWKFQLNNISNRNNDVNLLLAAQMYMSFIYIVNLTYFKKREIFV